MCSSDLRVALELGYRHPLELSSCPSIFTSDRFYLFSGRRNCLDVVQGGVSFFSAWALVRLGGGAPPVEQSAVPAEVGGVQVPLRLVTAAGPRPPVRASCIPMEQVAWLKKLIYLLPPMALARYSMCATADSLYLLSSSEVEFKIGRAHV